MGLNSYRNQLLSLCVHNTGEQLLLESLGEVHISKKYCGLKVSGNVTSQYYSAFFFFGKKQAQLEKKIFIWIVPFSSDFFLLTVHDIYTGIKTKELLAKIGITGFSGHWLN